MTSDKQNEIAAKALGSMVIGGAIADVFFSDEIVLVVAIASALIGVIISAKEPARD